MTQQRPRSDLATSDIITGGVICDVDSDKHAVTKGYQYSAREVHALHDALIRCAPSERLTTWSRVSISIDSGQ